MRWMEYSGGIAYDLAILPKEFQENQVLWISMPHLGG
jgi:hypothetical protein